MDAIVFWASTLFSAYWTIMWFRLRKSSPGYFFSICMRFDVYGVSLSIFIFNRDSLKYSYALGDAVSFFCFFCGFLCSLCEMACRNPA